MSMLSASASSAKWWLRIHITAIPMRVTNKPQARGTRAAIGLPEHEQEQHDQDRKRDPFALVERVEGSVVQSLHERRPAGELRLDGRPDLSQRRLHGRHGLLRDLLLGLAHLERQQRLSGRLAQGRVASDREGAQHLDPVDALEPRDQCLRLSLERRLVARGSLEEHGQADLRRRTGPR